jgi:apoptosis-inducing factor 3
VPFFWSRHYDASIQYVGHAERWDTVDIEGNVAKGDCLVRYLRGRKVLAVASMGREAETLRSEAEFERQKQSRTREPVVLDA